MSALEYTSMAIMKRRLPPEELHEMKVAGSEKTVMGEWKAQLSLRVRQDLRREIEEFGSFDVCGREKRKWND